MTSKQPTEATIRADSPRAARWMELLGSLTVPVRSPVTTEMAIYGHGVVDVYLVDVEKLTPEVFERIAAAFSAEYLLDIDVVRQRLREPHGLPVLAEDCTVTFDGRDLL